MVTGNAPVIFAPLIFEPTTTTSSASDASCACRKNGVVKIINAENTNLRLLNI